MNNRSIWMQVDLKNGEIPIIIAYSAEELAEKCGVKVTSIFESRSRAKKHGWRCQYVKVEEDDE